jgi:hypothetical protein
MGPFVVVFVNHIIWVDFVDYSHLDVSVEGSFVRESHSFGYANHQQTLYRFLDLKQKKRYSIELRK